MGIYGAMHPGYGPTAFLLVQVGLGAYCAFRLIRGLLRLRRDRTLAVQGGRDVGFGVGSLVSFTAVTLWVFRDLL